MPEQGQPFEAKFAGTQVNGRDRFQTDYILGPLQVPPGGRPRPRARCSPAPRKSTSSTSMRENYAIPKFDLLIDWGWFYFLTKPMFFAL